MMLGLRAPHARSWGRHRQVSRHRSSASIFRCHQHTNGFQSEHGQPMAGQSVLPGNTWATHWEHDLHAHVTHTPSHSTHSPAQQPSVVHAVTHQAVPQTAAAAYMQHPAPSTASTPVVFSSFDEEVTPLTPCLYTRATLRVVGSIQAVWHVAMGLTSLLVPQLLLSTVAPALTPAQAAPAAMIIQACGAVQLCVGSTVALLIRAAANAPELWQPGFQRLLAATSLFEGVSGILMANILGLALLQSYPVLPITGVSLVTGVLLSFVAALGYLIGYAEGWQPYTPRWPDEIEQRPAAARTASWPYAALVALWTGIAALCCTAILFPNMPMQHLPSCAQALSDSAAVGVTHVSQALSQLFTGAWTGISASAGLLLQLCSPAAAGVQALGSTNAVVLTLLLQAALWAGLTTTTASLLLSCISRGAQYTTLSTALHASLASVSLLLAAVFGNVISQLPSHVPAHLPVATLALLAAGVFLLAHIGHEEEVRAVPAEGAGEAAGSGPLLPDGAVVWLQPWEVGYSSHDQVAGRAPMNGHMLGLVNGHTPGQPNGHVSGSENGQVHGISNGHHQGTPGPFPANTYPASHVNNPRQEYYVHKN